MDVVSDCFFLSSWPEEKHVTKRETVKPISRVSNDETQEKYISWKFINKGLHVIPKKKFIFLAIWFSLSRGTKIHDLNSTSEVAREYHNDLLLNCF